MKSLKLFTGIIEVSDGIERPYAISVQYCENGLLHRKDGPAVKCPNGYKEYWLNGQIYSYNEWKATIKNSEEK